MEEFSCKSNEIGFVVMHGERVDCNGLDIYLMKVLRCFVRFFVFCPCQQMDAWVGGESKDHGSEFFA